MKTLLIILALSGLVDMDAAMLYLSGASSIEDMDEESVERFRRLAANPPDLNHCSRSSLSASGLFTPLQIASLLDYRSRNGDILSFAELSLVDGFNPEFAQALRFFVCLESNAPPGSRDDMRYAHELRVKASLKQDGSTSAGFRYEGRLGQRAELLLSEKTLSAAYYGKRYLGKLVLGSFNARFAQGLLAWSGFSMSGYSSISSFYKRASGISASSSSLTENFGLACDWNLGSYVLSLGHSFSGSSIANLSRNWRKCSLGATLSTEGASADIQLALPQTGIFAELACRWDGSPAVLAGAHWNPAYAHKYALLLRAYSPVFKEYSGVALGMELPAFLLTADWGYRTDKQLSQTKLIAKYSPSFALDSLLLNPEISAKARYRPSDVSALRLELRAELGLGWKSWLLNLRADVVRCSSLAWLWYVEAGRKTEEYGVYLRGSMFRADDWDDRIYVYERNAPGAFSVPAYYGRGWSASLYAYWHINRAHSVYLRLEKTDYPWNLSSKAGKSALKLQYRHRF